ncbi:amidase [Goekera deserti]|uniref:amidase n=1 Tax=Goekera deserti TaxID=2497753 RepID=UPI0013915BF5|nr:amidase [Goekera deserti]
MTTGAVGEPAAVTTGAVEEPAGVAWGPALGGERMAAARGWAGEGLRRSRERPLPLPTPADGSEPAHFAALLARPVAPEPAGPAVRHPAASRSVAESSRAELPGTQLAAAPLAAAQLAAAQLAAAQLPVAGQLHLAGVTGLLAGFAAGAFTPTDVVDELTARIAERGARTGAVLRVLAGAADAAAESSARWRAGNARPLEGVPFGVKDVLDVAGAVVTSGSRVTGDRIAATDATAVARWRAAGAVPLAMLATSEFACGAPQNGRYGAVRNPWDQRRWTGGSSTGSGAALADRLVPLALGTDTAGSIRLPSAWCGTTGLKPTYGRVPRTGVATLSWTLDHVGPMARTAEDLALVLPLLSGPDGVDPSALTGYDQPGPLSPDLTGLRVGVPGSWFTDCVDSQVLLAFEAALTVLVDAGAQLVPVAEGDLQPVFDEAWTILYAELASGHEGGPQRAGLYDDGLLDRLSRGVVIGATDYLRALRRRASVTAELAARLFGGADVLLTPGPGARAPLLADLLLDVDGEQLPMLSVHSRNTVPFDLTGMPALMLPAGTDDHGMPMAVQVVAPHHRDELCLRVGLALQARTAHHRAVPPG